MDHSEHGDEDHGDGENSRDSDDDLWESDSDSSDISHDEDEYRDHGDGDNGEDSEDDGEANLEENDDDHGLESTDDEGENSTDDESSDAWSGVSSDDIDEEVKMGVVPFKRSSRDTRLIPCDDDEGVATRSRPSPVSRRSTTNNL
ncbi:hypothetical protein B0T17DRAFT_611323 [Bombardia bombarda]|uniref:Uncharacterized protein n=1 Tax=Bombardia bombarda TaxID=252184 RepID=A0AA40CEC8_9PEZI|nr:hypothetical protein B0T17DRAFT_611323 [Bombardia bombarda]